MNNQVHGMCSKCISKFDPQTPPVINYQCQRCGQNQSQFITNDIVICMQCFLKFKQSSSILKKSLEIKITHLTQVPKTEMNTSIVGGFLSRNGKMIKKLEKIFTSCDLKTSAILHEINKKAIIAGSLKQTVPWEKIIDKCHKTSPLIFFFVGKELIFGAFHTQQVKLSSGEGSIVEDVQSGLFMTERAKYDLNIYRTSKSTVRYSHKSKSILFGDPSSFQILFTGKEIVIKSEFTEQLKWQNVFIVKV